MKLKMHESSTEIVLAEKAALLREVGLRARRGICYQAPLINGGIYTRGKGRRLGEGAKGSADETTPSAEPEQHSVRSLGLRVKKRADRYSLAYALPGR